MPTLRVSLLGSPGALRVDRQAERADLVGGVAVRRDPVRARNYHIHPPCRHQRGCRGVHDERCGEAVVHELVRGEARACSGNPVQEAQHERRREAVVRELVRRQAGACSGNPVHAALHILRPSGHDASRASI